MNDRSIEALLTYLAWALVSWLQALDPVSACGAAVGCAFLIAYPDAVERPVFRKVFGMVFSWGVGYSVGTFVAGLERPWNSLAMFAAIFAAAFAAAIFGALNLMFKNDGPLPNWLERILDRVPFLKSRNNPDDSH